MPHSVIASQALLAALSKLEVRHTALHETNEETKLINEKLRDENEVLKAKNAELAALVLLLKTEKHADAAVVAIANDLDESKKKFLPETSHGTEPALNVGNKTPVSNMNNDRKVSNNAEVLTR